MIRNTSSPTTVACTVLTALLLSTGALAHEPDFSDDFDRDGCTFGTYSNNPWHPIWPGYSLLLEGEEEDDEGETVSIAVRVTILEDTEMVDGVRTRVLEEREWEDEELVEVSRNFVAECRQTGDIWYFGEDVDDYEDGEIVGHEGAWRAGEDGAEAGILMPGNPLNGARYFQEMAPEAEALDQGEVQSRGNTLEVPFDTFTNVLIIVDSTPLDPEEADEKFYAYGIGIIKDEAAELVEIDAPSCLPDGETLCLLDGRFEVQATWMDPDGNGGPAGVNQVSADSGELWFSSPGNVELLVKVLDGCVVEGFDTVWFFAAGLTNLGTTITVRDTVTEETRTYENPLGTDFEPVLDTGAFAACD